MNKKTKNQFNPNYAITPGTVLQEWLDENGQTQVDLASRMGRAKKTIHEIIKGIAPITAETALQLEKVTGVEAGLWNNLEAQYREFCARQKEHEALTESVGMLPRFSYSAMARNGWVAQTTEKVVQVKNLLQFYAVASFKEWETTYTALEGAARESSAFKSEIGDLSAWLRRGEIEASRIECVPYDEKIFMDSLRQLRHLTTESIEHQSVEIPRLCSAAGVAHVFVPELPKTHVSGFTRWLTPQKALIQQSLRHKRNDHLWFTFFHEAAHILLHGKKERFLEYQGRKDLKEDQANEWARNFLIPPEAWDEFMKTYKLYLTDAIVRTFAQEQGIAPGIVAGRIQHETKNYAIHHRLCVPLKLVAKDPK